MIMLISLNFINTTKESDAENYCDNIGKNAYLQSINNLIKWLGTQISDINIMHTKGITSSSITNS